MRLEAGAWSGSPRCSSSLGSGAKLRVVTIPLFAVGLAVSSAAQVPCTYDVTYLPQGPAHPIYGVPPTYYTGLNNLGECVGYYNFLGEVSFGFIWSAETGMVSLPSPPPGYSNVQPLDINDHGVVVGELTGPPGTGLGYLGFVLKDGVYTILPPFSGGAWSRAYAVNNAGQVVGRRSIGNPATPELDVNPYSAFVWQGGAFIDLGVGPGPNSEATEISETGVITGWTGQGVANSVTARGFVATTESFLSIPPIPNGVSSVAECVDASGRVVVWGKQSTSNSPSLGWLWNEGVWTPFEPLSGATSGTAWLVNSEFFVGGSGPTSTYAHHLVLWRGTHPIDVTTALNLPIRSARAYNQDGQILALFDDPCGSCLDSYVLLTPLSQLSADLDMDGIVHLSDLGQLLAGYGESALGDLDNDGDTDFEDLGVLLAQFGSQCLVH